MEIDSQNIQSHFDTLLSRLTLLCHQHYRERLVSLAVFGSVGRGTPHPGSDIDLLLVVDNLPVGRLQRVREFQPIEDALASHPAQMAEAGLHSELSPILKTPHEVQQGSPLFLDMVEDARILYDRDGFLRKALQNFGEKLRQLGARRIWHGNAWLWDLKPDYQPGEVFEL